MPIIQTNALLKSNCKFGTISTESFQKSKFRGVLNMSENINFQITRLRKRMKITQEELAKAVGVSNQAVSKWESAICCPDIQLLPVLAQFFGVTIDELMGVSEPHQVSLQGVCEDIKSLFLAFPEDEHFSLAFMLSIILHKCVVSKGFQNGIYKWTDGNGEIKQAYENWGTSICSEPQGETVYIRNATFFTNHNNWRGTTSADIRNILAVLKKHADDNVLKVMFALYELTFNNFDLYVSIEDICGKSRLSENEVKSALEILDVQIKDTSEGERYRLHGAFMHIPPMLMLLGDKN